MDEHAFGLMITNVQMLKVKGLELLKRVRCGESAASQSLNIILVIAHVGRTSNRNGARRGWIYSKTLYGADAYQAAF